MNYITVIKAQVRGYICSFHFRKYILLGHIYHRAKEFSIGGLGCGLIADPRPLSLRQAVPECSSLAARSAVTTYRAGQAPRPVP